jgi:hypothetical protein
MNIKHIVTFSILFLTSCSTTPQNSLPVIDKNPPISHSWNISPTGTQIIDTGSVQIPSNINSISVWADETKDVTLILNENKWELGIDYWTWARVKVHFISEGMKTLKVSLQTPWDINWNIRVSQIIFPDGTADGPFWKDLNYKLTQSGSYQLILFANMMAWDPWSWKINLNLELK